MAKKRKAGGSIAGLQNQAKRLRAQLSAINKKKRDDARAKKLATKVASLKNKVKSARKRTTKK